MSQEIDIAEEQLPEFERALDELSRTLIESKVDVNVGVYALMKMLIVSTYKIGISKPNLLAMISEEWELIDSQVKGGECDRN